MSRYENLAFFVRHELAEGSKGDQPDSIRSYLAALPSRSPSVINAVDFNQRTAIYWAAKCNLPLVCKYLIDLSADVEQVHKDGWSPLMIAAHGGHIKVLRVLLQTGKAEVSRQNHSGKTAVDLARDKGHLEVAEFLLHSTTPPVFVRIGLCEGSSALGDNVDSLRTYFHLHPLANLNEVDHRGRTAIYWCAKFNLSKCCSLLIRGGADVDLEHGDGWTPLMIACFDGFVDTVKVLCSEGNARTDAVNKRGQTALQLATERNHKAVVAFLTVELSRAVAGLSVSTPAELKRVQLLAYPIYWHVNPSTSFFTIDVTELLGSSIERLMNSTARPSSHGGGRDGHGIKFKRFAVTKVLRVENKDLWLSYASHRLMLANKSHHQPQSSSIKPITAEAFQASTLLHAANEMYLFHGTNADVSHTIARNGFDSRIGFLDGMFGAGCYFAESASKSDQYTRGSTLQMFLSRVSMGHVMEELNSRQGITRAPCTQFHYDPTEHKPTGPGTLRCAHERFDSLLALSQLQNSGATLKEFREFIVYDRFQCYPEYLITYERHI